MDGGVGDCKQWFSIISTRLYRVEFAVLGGWRVARDNISVILYERPHRCDGMEGDIDRGFGASRDSNYVGGI
jgi:hypothetical protein